MSEDRKEIYCCQCERDVYARLTNGREIYPHRKDLFRLPFWRCDGCGNYVGCHHKTKNRTAPMGHIATPEIRAARVRIHAVLDPIWKLGKIKRKELYLKLSEKLGWNYHTSKIKSVAEADLALGAIKAISGDFKDA